jgi:hypothetical protein
MIEGNFSPDNLQADVVIFLTDSPLCNLDPILKVKNIIVVNKVPRGNTIDLRWKDSIGVPVFDLDMGDIDKEEWKNFIAKTRRLLGSLKT